MGLHQAIASKTLSFPCDCGRTDDHEVDLTGFDTAPIVDLTEGEDDSPEDSEK